MSSLIEQHLAEHAAVISALEALTGSLQQAGDLCATTLKSGGRIFLCGNGGSAADAQHIAAELVGRFVADRRSLPAIALTTDTSALTAIANDYGYEQVFSRQLEGLAQAGDILIAISTSGHSPNVLAAVETAHAMKLTVIGLSGKGGGRLHQQAHCSLVVPSDTTARIQECHILIGHLLCALIEQALELG